MLCRICDWSAANLGLLKQRHWITKIWTMHCLCMNHYTSGWSWSTNDLRTIFHFIKTVTVRTLVVNILCWKVWWAVVVYQGVIYRSKCGGCVYACMPACDLWGVCHHHQHQLRGFMCQISKLRKICNICSFPPSQIYFCCLDSCQSGVAEISL